MFSVQLVNKYYTYERNARRSDKFLIPFQVSIEDAHGENL